MPKKRLVSIGWTNRCGKVEWFFVLPPGTGHGSKLDARPGRCGHLAGLCWRDRMNNGFKPKECIYFQVPAKRLSSFDGRHQILNSAGKGGAMAIPSGQRSISGLTNSGLADGGVGPGRSRSTWPAVTRCGRQKHPEGRGFKGKKIAPVHASLRTGCLSPLWKLQPDERIVEIAKNPIGKDAPTDADLTRRWCRRCGGSGADVRKLPRDRRTFWFLTVAAQNLIADVMVAREDFIKEHPDVIKAFIQGWFDGTTEANRNPDKAVKVLMDNEPLYKDLGEQVTKAGLATVKWADLPDNTQMFGLDGSDPLFDRIFKQAGAAWVKRGYINRGMAPDQAKDVTFLKEIYAANPVPASALTKVSSQASGGTAIAPISTKPVNITFPSNSSTVSADQVQVIDQIATLAITYSNSRILIEGNTDSAGSREHNIELSKQRAQAVVDYLVQHYKDLDKNRFEAKGNGPDKPVQPNTTDAGKAANRRTDIAIVPTK